jgi:hypothetical protein
MTPDEQQILLVRLAEALQRRMVTVALVNKFPGQPERRVVKDATATPTITARIRDYQPHDGVWLYWWFWWQPIRSVEELERMTNTFCDVVLAVERER